MMIFLRRWTTMNIAEAERLHIVYGEDRGILAGYAHFLNYAFETAFRAFETAPQEP